MAKVGEGDERWIVSERADGTNVNQWHWQELDCTDWSKEKLNALLSGKQVMSGEGALWVSITEVTKCEGDCYVNRRKGKIIPGYELELEIGWKAEAKGEGSEADKVYGAATGSFKVPYLGDENMDEEADVSVAVKSGGSLGERVRQALLKKGVVVIQEAIRELIKCLKEGGPAAGGGKAANESIKAQQTKKTAPVEREKSNSNNPEKKTSNDKTRKLTIRETFYCRPMDIYEALMDEGRVKAYTQSDASISQEAGGSFSMYGGSVQGKQIELKPGEKIVQKWRFSSWSDDHYSNVTILLSEPERGSTVMELSQSNIPEEDKFGNGAVLDQTEKGWRENIFRRIRMVFGYGV